MVAGPEPFPAANDGFLIMFTEEYTLTTAIANQKAAHRPFSGLWIASMIQKLQRPTQNAIKTLLIILVFLRYDAEFSCETVFSRAAARSSAVTENWPVFSLRRNRTNATHKGRAKQIAAKNRRRMRGVRGPSEQNAATTLKAPREVRRSVSPTAIKMPRFFEGAGRFGVASCLGCMA